MASVIASVLDDPQVRQVLNTDKTYIFELEKKVEALKVDSAHAHLKATHRRIAIKGLERRAEHLECLLSAARGDSNRINKEEFATRTLLRMCRGDAFAAFDALVEFAFGGRVDELCEHIATLDTETCESGCGEWTTDTIHYDNEGVPLCHTCWSSLTDEEDEG